MWIVCGRSWLGNGRGALKTSFCCNMISRQLLGLGSVAVRIIHDRIIYIQDFRFSILFFFSLLGIRVVRMNEGI